MYPPGPPYPMQPVYQPGPPPAERRAKIVALTTSALAVVAVIVAGVVVLTGNDGTARGGESVTATGQPGPAAGTPAATAYAYVKALADGDAAAALATSAVPPRSLQYTTKDVLRMQLMRAPITDIAVENAPAAGDTDTRKTVTMSAKFGDQQSSATVVMVKPEGSADWMMPKAAITVAGLQPDWQNKIVKVFTLAGIPAVEETDAVVFPGATAVFSASPYLDVTTAPLLLDSLGSDASATWSPKAAINDRGRAATLDEIAFRLKSCFRPDLAAGSTLPCPPAPAGVDLSKVTDVGPLTDSSKVTYGDLDQSTLTMPVTGQVAYTLTVDSGSVPATADINATMDFTQPDTEPFLDFP